MDQNLKLAVSSYSFLGAVRRGMLSYDRYFAESKGNGFAGVEYAGLELPAGMTAENTQKRCGRRQRLCSLN